MAAAQLIAVGTSAAASADQTITDTPLTIGLNVASASNPIPANAEVYVQAKDAGGAYWTVGVLNAVNPGAVISGPGVYRLYRPTQTDPVGAFNA